MILYGAHQVGKTTLSKTLLEPLGDDGLYPHIAFAAEAEALMLLDNLSSRYLYKDVLEFKNLKRADVLVE